jgi:Ca2+/Na+ antiporter
LVIFGHVAGAAGENFYEYETNPLAMSSMAGTVVVIATMWLARPNRAIFRILAAVCIPIGLAVIMRTGSRGQLIATGVATVVALPIAYRLREARSIAMLVLAAIVVAGMAWWATSLVDIDSSRWESSRSLGDAVGRFDNAEALLRASSATVGNIIFGLGNSSAFKILGIYPHVTGLEVVAEEGLIGGAMYFTILLLAIRNIRRIAAAPDFTDFKRNVLATITGLLVFELIVSWKQGSLLISVYVFAYAIILARLESPIVSARIAPMIETAAAKPLVPRFQNLLR